ncbi:hypothetical protein GO988_22345 [Hymenobacter sp. HMF4947]|uniref:Uncharacterized protein n=1 Tax=Hymenobacter ginkgonis TaxID=2682976 RepID=A0A7K1TLT0_9BACT|nr:hypothetical protein [Hymenobacter ginkgonis]MVN79081.1 hypothetical protein [Hymenobacter ginkgonis]
MAKNASPSSSASRPVVPTPEANFDLTALVIPPSLSIEEKLLAIERQLAALPMEVCVVFNAEGQEVLRVQSSDFSVEFTNQQVGQAHGGYMTHNHPAGTGLSWRDVRTAHHLNLLQIRAVSNLEPPVVHVITRPTDGWATQECEQLCVSEFSRIKTKFGMPGIVPEDYPISLKKKINTRLGKFAVTNAGRFEGFFDGIGEQGHL